MEISSNNEEGGKAAWGDRWLSGSKPHPPHALMTHSPDVPEKASESLGSVQKPQPPLSRQILKHHERPPEIAFSSHDSGLWGLSTTASTRLCLRAESFEAVEEIRPVQASHPAIWRLGSLYQFANRRPLGSKMVYIHTRLKGPIEASSGVFRTPFCQDSSGLFVTPRTGDAALLCLGGPL